MAPTKPLRLQVLDRFVAVLNAITEGEDYWMRPALVVRRHIGDREAPGFPIYGVWTGTGQAPEEINGEYTEDFEVLVDGVVQSHEDLIEAEEHALADIRKAIDADSRDRTTAGSLGTLAVKVTIGRSECDSGEALSAGFGYFKQWFSVQVAGDPFGA